MSGCLDDNAIVALLEPDVPDAERAAWMAHIDACAECRALVADTVRTESDSDGPRVLAPGTRLGRYVVLETIGAGAMGIVYAAYDPQLGRKIALKLLRPDPEATSTAEGRDRLLREAQLLAKLSHPHVTTIHDVGAFDDEIFLAMELVEGDTLGAWLATPRDARSIVRVMRQVGEGLAAAHAAGLVHRDLKPDNVLVDTTERAVVTDFGLARGSEDLDGPAAGTPAYMDPTTRVADAASDQYAYCVTFWEALYGARPVVRGSDRSVPGSDRPSVPGSDRPSVPGSDRSQAPASAGPPNSRSSSGRHRVPAWLRRVVQRGLSTDRDARYPSMTALLAALDAGPAISPRRIAIGFGAIAIVVTLLVAWRRPPAAAIEVCTGAPAAWAGVWTDRERSAMHDAFGTSGRASASNAATQLDRILDERGAAWRTMYTEACVATRVRGEASEAQLDLRMRCLGDRRNEIGSLVRLLAVADGELVDRSISAVLALPSLADCANVRSLATASLPADPATRAEIDRLGRSLADANALEYAGNYRAGRTLADAALANARLVGYAPLVGKLELVIGRLAYDLREFGDAGRALHDAAAIAQDTGEAAIAADAWTLLVRMVGFLENRPDEARVWSRYAEGAIRRLGGDDEREAARLRHLATVVWRREGKFDEARGLIERARALFERSHGPRYDFDLAWCDEGLAGIAFDTARPADALVLHDRAAATRVRLFGDSHPSIATALVNRGEDLTKLGRAREAIDSITRAIAMVDNAYNEHRLAAAYRANGDYALALERDRRALATTSHEGDGGTDWEAWALTGEGLDLLALHRDAEAIAPLERAVTEREAHSLPVEKAESRFALARAIASTNPARATTLATEARDLIGPDAARFGGWYETLHAEIVAWLARTL